MRPLAELLECPRCGDTWPCEETRCESCGARLLPKPRSTPRPPTLGVKVWR